MRAAAGGGTRCRCRPTNGNACTCCSRCTDCHAAALRWCRRRGLRSPRAAAPDSVAWREARRVMMNKRLLAVLTAALIGVFAASAADARGGGGGGHGGGGGGWQGGGGGGWHGGGGGWHGGGGAWQGGGGGWHGGGGGWHGTAAGTTAAGMAVTAMAGGGAAPHSLACRGRGGGDIRTGVAITATTTRTTTVTTARAPCTTSTPHHRPITTQHRWRRRRRPRCAGIARTAAITRRCGAATAAGCVSCRAVRRRAQ